MFVEYGVAQSTDDPFPILLPDTKDPEGFQPLFLSLIDRCPTTSATTSTPPILTLPTGPEDPLGSEDPVYRVVRPSRSTTTESHRDPEIEIGGVDQRVGESVMSLTILIEEDLVLGSFLLTHPFPCT
jgi:hypothetical protein